jgi:lipoprotein-releasing system permease protein
MYELLLCWRYLKTRYLAIACIISVMLGVATLIVVNSVMNGFSTKLRTLLHSVVSDIGIEAGTMEGFHDPVGKIARIRKDAYLNEQIDAMAITIDAFAIVQFQNVATNEFASRPVRVMGIEMKSRSAVGGFQKYLEKQKDARAPSFDIPEEIRRAHAFQEELIRQDREWERKPVQDPLALMQLPKLAPNAEIDNVMKQFFKDKPDEKPLPKPAPVPHRVRIPQGAVVGHLIANIKWKDPDTKQFVDVPTMRVGDRIELTTIATGERIKPRYDSFVVVDFFKSGMSEYDANSIFIPLEHLQAMRGMDERATNILIKLKNYNEAKNVVDALGKMFAHERLSINTWEDKQGPLLRAIEIEKSILNILLFMIIAVAGFGILAIFSMIVSEKTRDIGILKALGASSGGVMKIFLTYGLLLGVVGAAFGTILGLSVTWNINGIEMLIAKITGSRVFQGDVYYFTEIPTDVQPTAILIVNLGAVAIAVVFSILPALKAALLQPVQALRYE